MELEKIFQLTTSKVKSLIILLFIAGFMAWLMIGDVSRMQAATTNYDYYQNSINLIVNIAITYFFCIFLLMCFLTYINKQYSKWCVRLFYFLGISIIIYYAFAGIYIEHVFSHVEHRYIWKFNRLAHRLYTGPLYWMIIGYFFFVPKILKDAQKLQEEQDLTI